MGPSGESVDPNYTVRLASTEETACSRTLGRNTQRDMHSSREAWSCPRLGVSGNRDYPSGDISPCALTDPAMARGSAALKISEMNALGPPALQLDPLVF